MDTLPHLMRVLHVGRAVAVVLLACSGCEGKLTGNRLSSDDRIDSDDTAPKADAGQERPEDDTLDDGGPIIDDASSGATANEDAGILPASDAGLVPPPVAGSAGCGRAAPPPEGLQTLEVNGKSRTFIVHMPKTYQPDTTYPLLFGFHGASRTAADFDNDKGTFRFGPALGDRTILVYPNALPKEGGATTWSRDTDDDLAFFDAMVSKITAEACVDPDRVVATGHSSGGYFANTLGCRRGEVLRAIAPVAGGVRDFKNCTGEVAVWMAHGTQDTQVALSQGEAARTHWAKANGCSESPAPGATSPSPCVAHAGCRTGYPLHWCAHDQPTYGKPPTYHGWPDFATTAITAFMESLP